MEERDGLAKESHKLYHQNYFYHMLIRSDCIHYIFQNDNDPDIF